ncbi:MAG: Rpn family recombination-promoting nuclease/putative transposase [Clostridia bacterium]|nr:Rpn family recombination-promoting nuclease/putative transposase [Clostridia bacterium]
MYSSGSELEESRKKHDELFRSLLNDKEEFVRFIKYFINPESKLTKDSIQKYNRSFVTSKYKSRNSDIVYKEKSRKIYYLIEHQSTIDYNMPYRMLEYSYEIIRDTVEKENNKKKNYKYPNVIPIVLYTGNLKWKVPKVIGFFRDGLYKDVGLSFKYILIDTNDYNKEKLFNSESMVGLAMQAEKSNTNEEATQVIEKMFIERPHKREEIYRIIEYIFRDQIDLNENFEKTIKYGEVKKAMVTVRERLKENNKKILMQERNKINNIVKNLINIGMKKEDVLKITGLSIEEINKITKE